MRRWVRGSRKVQGVDIEEWEVQRAWVVKRGFLDVHARGSNARPHAVRLTTGFDANSPHIPCAQISKCGRASVQWDKVITLQPMEQEPDGAGNFMLRTNSRNSRKCAYG